MEREDKIIELLEKILIAVEGIKSNTSWNETYLSDIKSDLDDINKSLNC